MFRALTKKVMCATTVCSAYILSKDYGTLNINFQKAFAREDCQPSTSTQPPLLPPPTRPKKKPKLIVPADFVKTSTSNTSMDIGSWERLWQTTAPKNEQNSDITVSLLMLNMEKISRFTDEQIEKMATSTFENIKDRPQFSTNIFSSNEVLTKNLVGRISEKATDRCKNEPTENMYLKIDQYNSNDARNNALKRRKSFLMDAQGKAAFHSIFGSLKEYSNLVVCSTEIGKLIHNEAAPCEQINDNINEKVAVLYKFTKSSNGSFTVSGTKYFDEDES